MQQKQKAAPCCSCAILPLFVCPSALTYPTGAGDAGGARGAVGAMAPTDQLTLSQRGLQTALQLSPPPGLSDYLRPSPGFTYGLYNWKSKHLIITSRLLYKLSAEERQLSS